MKEMNFYQFINSINQIRHAEHVSFIPGAIRHLAWFFRRLRNKFPVELNISKSKLIVNEPNGVAALINSMGIYDFNNMNLIRSFLEQSEGAVFFDIGANIGSYTIVASEIPSAKVVAFEPHPTTFKQLKQNIILNKRNNITMINAAVSDMSGSVKLSDEKPQMSSINRVLKNIESEPGIQVKSITLDQVCNELNLYPNIVKIDTEGHEFKILMGFRKAIQHADILIIERGEKENISLYLKSLGFKGPFYFHYLKRAILTIPQKRSEDTIFIKRNSFSSLENMGLNVLDH